MDDRVNDHLFYSEDYHDGYNYQIDGGGAVLRGIIQCYRGEDRCVMMQRVCGVGWDG